MTSPLLLVQRAARLGLAGLACALLGAHPALPPRHRPAPAATGPIAFENPAGMRPAGPLGSDPFAAVLPSGRFVQPEGKSVLVGPNAVGLALSPDGRYAVVVNADNRPPLAGAPGGDSLAVVDTRWMIVVDTYRAPAGSFFGDIRLVSDPAEPTRTLAAVAGGPSGKLALFQLDGAGHLTPDAIADVTLPPGPQAQGAFTSPYPTGLAVAPSGRLVYVTDRLSGQAAIVDLLTRQIVGTPAATGLLPAAAAVVGGRLLVTNEGLAPYGVLATPAVAPPFSLPAFDAARGSALQSLPLAPNGAFAGAPANLQMDPAPDGVRTVGGAHPTALAVTPNGADAFVAMTNVDRIATVALGSEPQVIGGTELRLYDRGPYGTQPVALALSRNGARLYVALAGINAVAVLDARDPQHVHRLGLIPTGWSPAHLALSRDDATLFVANAVGIDTRASAGATLERIDLRSLRLRDATRRALQNEHRVHPVHRSAIVPEILGTRRSSAIAHVITIFVGTSSYDAMLGDLTDASGRVHGSGDPAFVQFGANVTPNLHALALTFGLAANFYSEGSTRDLVHAYGTAGMPDAYALGGRFVDDGIRPLQGTSNDPEDYPRAGYVFDSLAARGLAYRDYGDLLSVAGYAPQPKNATPALSLGGWYTLDVPALAALRDRVDLQYPGWNPDVTDTARAAEFVRDFGAATNAQPGGFAYTDVWLPTAAAPGEIPAAAAVADADRALGAVVAAITHDPAWPSTAIFVVPDGVESARDHVDPHRAYALVISPYARRHLVGMQHLSTAGVLKTEEEMLGLPALSLGDALASDFGGFFTPTPNTTPFDAVGQAAPASE